MQEYFLKTKLLTGPGAAGYLQKLVGESLFLVADPFFEKNGTAKELVGISQCKRSCVYSRIQPDPTVEQVANGAAELKKFQPDTVVALGGGSAMDCAKAMLYFSGVKATFIAIPTTSGSGSEVTDFAVLTHGGIKHPLIDKAICPQIAILDSSLLKQLPRTLVADTGFDAISHALEGYVATGAGTVTDALAEKAFSISMASLTKSYAGSQSVRQELLEASAMAAMSFTRAGLGLCHAMSHTLGTQLHLPHGRLNAILLPSVIRLNEQAARGKYAHLARLCGLGGASDAMAVRSLINELIRLRNRLELPATLEEAGAEPAAVKSGAEAIVKATLADPCCKSNPVAVQDYMIRSVLEEVTRCR